MRRVDVAVVGGGLAGSLAAMLGRARIATVLIEPHRIYPPDFRSEKIDALQLRLLRRTGMDAPVLAAATPTKELWIARYGRLVEKRRAPQYGIFYDHLVHTVRAEVPANVTTIEAKATAISTSPDRQIVTLSSGEEISARLVVLATGLNNGLRQALGIEREQLSKCHSISLGFNVRPVGRSASHFPALTYFAESVAKRAAYFTVFPIGGTLRSNMFVYREPKEPWLDALRQCPEQAIFEALPGLRRFTGTFEVQDLRVRPVDLYRTKGCEQAPGIVLIGDAFATSCPAAGRGINKVLTDAERLCHVYIPRWLATPGMDGGKIAAFYQDPVKRACDAESYATALYLRSLFTDQGLAWTARRLAKFAGHLAVGRLGHLSRLFRPDSAVSAAPGSNISIVDGQL